MYILPFHGRNSFMNLGSTRIFQSMLGITNGLWTPIYFLLQNSTICRFTNFLAWLDFSQFPKRNHIWDTIWILASKIQSDILILLLKNQALIQQNDRDDRMIQSKSRNFTNWVESIFYEEGVVKTTFQTTSIIRMMEVTKPIFVLKSQKSRAPRALLRALDFERFPIKRSREREGRKKNSFGVASNGPTWPKNYLAEV